jgi:hypothetical protein
MHISKQNTKVTHKSNNLIQEQIEEETATAVIMYIKCKSYAKYLCGLITVSDYMPHWINLKYSITKQNMCDVLGKQTTQCIQTMPDRDPGLI